MTVAYSGYDGSGGQPGNEWITITGETSTTLTMRAFAYEAGAATVSYTWGRVETGCCMGVVGCHGSFTSSVGEGELVTIGEIPAGKKDLDVQLTAVSDVDVQLYDTAANDPRFGAEGVAIIAYSDCGALAQGDACAVASGCGELAQGEVCNAGPLGNNDGTAEACLYRGRNYTYSGYYGDGTNLGHERVAISGVLNTALLMRAYGYAAGSFDVSYTYYEDVPKDERPTTPALYWDVADSNGRQPGVLGLFEDDLTKSAFVLRRGTSGEILTVHVPSNQPAAISCHLEGEVDGGAAAAPYPAKHVNFSYTQTGVITSVRATLSSAAPVGDYTCACEVVVSDSGAVLRGSKRVLILFNPYLPTDAAYMGSEADRSEYVEMTEGVLFQGLSDNFEGHVWWYDQFRTANVEVALRSLRRMPIADRGDPALLARHLSYAIGEDVCYGRWGDGDYRRGKPSGGYTCSASSTKCYSDATASRDFRKWEADCCVEPDAWRGTTSVLALHTQLGHRPVQYCQCFVYAALLTSFGRSLGLPSRPVTTFQSAHDTDANRAIDKFFTAEWEPIEGVTADSTWSFHVWTDMFFERRDAGLVLPAGVASAGGWQAVDATPQELSAGGSGLASQAKGVYQMGPASLALVRANSDPTCSARSALDVEGASDALRPEAGGCYDAQFVLSETNANINLWLRSDAASCAPGGGATLGCANTTDASSGTVAYYERQGTYETDPWGDELGTIGAMIYTKRVGPISDACVGDEDAEGWTCLGDGIDVTGTYKTTEPSGPGEPTSCASGGSFCQTVGPFALGDGHSRRRLSGSSGGVTWGIGVAPQIAGPLVNEPGHPMSWARVDVNVSADLPANVSCSFAAIALDYSGQPYVRDRFGQPNASGSTAKAQPAQTVALAAGGAHTFSFKVSRPHYRALSPTHLDAQAGLVPVRASEAFFTLSLNAYCHASNGAAFVRRVQKRLCEPIIATASRSRVACAAKRGTYPTAAPDSAALAHLTRANCAAVGITSPSVNDGVCTPANNVEGCFDGGDCCEYSCWAKNGQFTQLADDGGWEFAHRCYAIDDASDCIDPAMLSYAPPADYTKPPSPGAFTGDTATVAGSNNRLPLISLAAVQPAGLAQQAARWWQQANPTQPVSQPQPRPHPQLQPQLAVRADEPAAPSTSAWHLFGMAGAVLVLALAATVLVLPRKLRHPLHSALLAEEESEYHLAE